MGDQKHILDGIKVVEAATFIFGPAAGTVMADFGAEVVHIEHPMTGDPHRYLYLLKPLPESEHNYCWMLTGRNKKSIALNLKAPEGREAAYRLIKDADVFITNYHPSVLEALQLRYEDLEALNPKLIYAHATGYGEDGPEVEKPGYDATAWWARTGMMDIVRQGDGEMGLAVPGMGDHPGAMSVFGGIMLALFQRERTGTGTKVSSSLMANGIWSNSILLQAMLCGAPRMEPPVRTSPPNALVNFYRTADDKAIYLVMVQEDTEWGRFCEAIERPDLLEDPRFAELVSRREHSQELAQILEEAFAKNPLHVWRDILDGHKITFSFVARLDDLPDDPQLRANGLLREIQGLEGEPIRTIDSPIALLGADKVPAGRAPEIGEHSVEVLESLGYTAEQIASLVDSGVVRTA